MRNPLNKRLLRELSKNKGKYISIIILLSLSIGFISGFFLVQRSVKYTYDNSHVIGNVEDAHIELTKEINSDDNKIFDDNDVSVTKNYCVNIKEDKKLYRVYVNRGQLNIAGIFEGKLPAKDNEIMIEKIYATNNGLAVGDTIKLLDKEYVISAIAAFPDYSTLLRNNGDFLMDNKDFCVATVTQSAFDKLSGRESISYVYSYTLHDKSLNTKQQTDKLTDISKAFIEKKNYTLNAVIKEANKNITYLADDMGGDVPMMIVLFSIILVIMAFVFIVIIHGTIEEESKVIGTLLASGYTKMSILKHYLMVPLTVTVFSVVLGNIFGYTFFKEKLLDVYISSYSIFPFIVKFDWYALIITSTIPLFLIFSINYFYIRYKLKNKPLNFLRKELNKRDLKNAVTLPSVGFLSRYRLRVFLRNKGSFIVLFIGILFGNVLLIFALNVKPLLNNYVDEINDSMPSDYQTFLKGPLESLIVRKSDALVDNPGGLYQTEFVSDIIGKPKDDISLFTAISMQTDRPFFTEKTAVQIYGIDFNSKFFLGKRSEKMDGVYATEGFLAKLKLSVGDRVILYNKFKGEQYTVKIVGTTESFRSTISLVMPRDDLNKLLGNDKWYYNGVLSDSELGLDEKYVVTKIKKDDMSGVASQLIKTFSQMGYMILLISIAIFSVVIYVLSKSIIEKYTREIAYLRIFGYTDREINSVYIRVSTIFIILTGLVLIPIQKLLVSKLFELALLKIDAHISFYMPKYVIIYTFFALVFSYFFIRLFLLKKVKRIKMAEALKDVV